MIGIHPSAQPPSVTPSGSKAVLVQWFTDEVPDLPRRYWEEAYPAIADEAESIARAKAAGFDVVNTRRLPAQAWWDNYYSPMLERIAAKLPPRRDHAGGHC